MSTNEVYVRQTSTALFVIDELERLVKELRRDPTLLQSFDLSTDVPDPGASTCRRLIVIVRHDAIDGTWYDPRMLEEN